MMTRVAMDALLSLLWVWYVVHHWIAHKCIVRIVSLVHNKSGGYLHCAHHFYVGSTLNVTGQRPNTTFIVCFFVGNLYLYDRT